MKRSIFKKCLLKQVLVTLKTGDAFRGLFYKEDEQAIVLVNAELADPRADRQFIPASGEVVILVADIAYLQIL